MTVARAGFYSYDLLENLVGAALQADQPRRVLGFATREIGTSLSEPEDGSWTFVVQPVGATQTRLIARGRGEGVDGLMASLFSTLVFEPAHFVMERQILLGIKALAEGRHCSALGTRRA